MGRKYRVLLLCLLLMLLAGGASAQQNLDTLWTRTISSPGNEVFYAMAKANNGNILIAAYLDGDGELDRGRYVIEVAEGGSYSIITLIPTGIPFSSQFDFRETEQGYFEICHVRQIYQFDREGSIVLLDTMPTDVHYEWSIPFVGYERHHQWTRSSAHITGAYYAAYGYGEHVEQHQGGPGWGYGGNWLSIYDLSSGVVDAICFPCNAVALDLECRVEAQPQLQDGYWDLQVIKRCNQLVLSRIAHLPSYEITSLLVGIADDVWAYSIKQTGDTVLRPFYAVHATLEHDDPLVTLREGENAPAAIAAEVDLFGNLVVLGFADASPPDLGIRFDVIGNNTGMIGDSVLVNVLAETQPLGFMLLEDNSALVASYVWTEERRDILIARVDTIPTSQYIPPPPEPASLELLVEGPPAWGYRINTGTYSQNQVILENLCAEAHGTVTGQAAGRWDSGLAIFNVFFTADQALSSNSSDDTLWLIAPECESVDIAWTMSGVSGTTKGPFHPEVNVQTFLCRLEDGGVSVRFDIADATNTDSLFVRRRNSTGTDSVLIKTIRSFAGHYVVEDVDVPVNKHLTYYLTATDKLGRHWMLDGSSQEVFIDPAIVVPDDYTVYPPYPNPFNSQATFTFDIPTISRAELRIFDITGRQVATLVDEFKDPGTYTVTFDAADLPSGVYIYAFDSGNFSHHGKLLLLK